MAEEELPLEGNDQPPEEGGYIKCEVHNWIKGGPDGKCPKCDPSGEPVEDEAEDLEDLEGGMNKPSPEKEAEASEPAQEPEGPAPDPGNAKTGKAPEPSKTVVDPRTQPLAKRPVRPQPPARRVASLDDVGMIDITAPGMGLTTMGAVNWFCVKYADTSFFPKQYQGRPKEAAVAIMYGMQLGVNNPFFALQKIATINGVPSAHSELPKAIAMARVKGLQCIDEEIGDRPPNRADWKTWPDTYGYRCTVKRPGQEPVVREFTVADAKLANLWGNPSGKNDTWTKYPQRKLMFRARSWALRDGAPDALGGLMQAEESEDIIDVEHTEVVDAPMVDGSLKDKPKVDVEM